MPAALVIDVVYSSKNGTIICIVGHQIYFPLFSLSGAVQEVPSSPTD
jgi:hypothetical protein